MAVSNVDFNPEKKSNFMLKIIIPQIQSDSPFTETSFFYPPIVYWFKNFFFLYMFKDTQKPYFLNPWVHYITN